MDSKVVDVLLTDQQMALIHAVARERGITDIEAANQLMHEAIEQRYRRRLGRGPARVYTIRSKIPKK